MKIKEITVRMISYIDLSEAIQDEIKPEGACNDTIFWTKVPFTLAEISRQPFWNDFCKQNDFKPGERLLVEVSW